MSDLIDRQKAIDAINEECDKFEKMREGIVYAQGLRCAIPILDTMPAVDIDLSGYSDRLWKGAHERGKQDAMAKIVRCKECKYATMTTDGECKYCDIWFPDEPVYTEGDYFCASGERKEE